MDATLPFPLNDKVPPELRPYILNLWWDIEKLHRLKLPSYTVPLTDLLWHLDLPWWQFEGRVFSLTPRQVQAEPREYQEQYERTLTTDLRHPIIVRQQDDRLIIMDGIHRLLKAHLLSKQTIKVKLFDEQLISMIAYKGDGVLSNAQRHAVCDRRR